MVEISPISSRTSSPELQRQRQDSTGSGESGFSSNQVNVFKKEIREQTSNLNSPQTPIPVQNATFSADKPPIPPRGIFPPVPQRQISSDRFGNDQYIRTERRIKITINVLLLI